MTFVNTYPESLGKRPHHDLIDALQQMGMEVQHNKGRLPITIQGGQPRGGKITVSGNVSSQFLSSFLFMTPLLEEDSEIEVLHDLNPKLLWVKPRSIRKAGIVVEASEDLMHYRITGRQ